MVEGDIGFILVSVKVVQVNFLGSYIAMGGETVNVYRATVGDGGKIHQRNGMHDTHESCKTMAIKACHAKAETIEFNN